MYTQPRYPPFSGLLKYTTSPEFPASVGSVIPTVYFLETVTSPCKKSETASIPEGEFEVIFSEKITGPLNSEIALLSGPPSTRIERLKLPSTALVTFSPGRFPMSSPVTVCIGVSKISYLPVVLLNLLLPTYAIPLSFIPV